MTITQGMSKLNAWTIFRAEKLGHEEAEDALSNMTEDESEQYAERVKEFEMELAQIGIEAQNEAAALTEGNDDIAYLQNVKPWDWKATDYVTVVEVFKESKFEKLHLSALFRINNSEILLDLVKP